MPVSEGENADFIEESGSAGILPAGGVRDYLRFTLPVTKQLVGMPAGGVRNYLRFNSPVAKQLAANELDVRDFYKHLARWGEAACPTHFSSSVVEKSPSSAN